jgi:hypothetical protein
MERFTWSLFHESFLQWNSAGSRAGLLQFGSLVTDLVSGDQHRGIAVVIHAFAPLVH